LKYKKKKGKKMQIQKNISIDENLVTEIITVAEKETRSFSNAIEALLREALRAREKNGQD
jgi:hypothetical protein